MPREESFDFTKEVNEVERRLISRHKIDCIRTRNEKGQDVLEFKVQYGKYKIVCDELRDSFFIYCEENYSENGFEYMGTVQSANGVFFKISIW